MNNVFKLIYRTGWDVALENWRMLEPNHLVHEDYTDVWWEPSSTAVKDEVMIALNEVLSESL